MTESNPGRLPMQFGVLYKRAHRMAYSKIMILKCPASYPYQPLPTFVRPIFWRFRFLSSPAHSPLSGRYLEVQVHILIFFQANIRKSRNPGDPVGVPRCHTLCSRPNSQVHIFYALYRGWGGVDPRNQAQMNRVLAIFRFSVVRKGDEDPDMIGSMSSFWPDSVQ